MDAVGKNYLTDMGYVPRLFHEYKDSTYQIAYNQLRSNGYFRFFSKNKSSKIDFWAVKFDVNIFTDKTDFSYQEHDADLNLILRFLNSSELKLTAYH